MFSSSTQTCSIINVNPQNAYWVSNSSFTWTSSNTSIITVSSSGVLTSSANTGTCQITVVHKSTGVTREITVHVIVDYEGTYFLQNSEYEGYYMQVDNNDSPNYSTSGAKMELWEFDGGDYQKWNFTWISGEYYKITSDKSGLALSVRAGYLNTGEQYLAQEDYGEYDRQLWKITKTARGTFVIRPKSGEAYTTDWCMASGNPLLGIVNGVNVEQRAYSNDSDYKDEWELVKIQYSASVFNYYDKGYPVRYGETEAVSKERIKSYTEAVALRYLALFGLELTISDTTYFYSDIDECKGTVSSSNIDLLCEHTGTAHTDRNSVISDFSSHYTGNNVTTCALWTCHKIKSIATDGDPDYNRSCSSGTNIYMLEKNILFRTTNSQGVLMHELNHQYGAPDHYHELADSEDPTSCKFKSICSECGDDPRLSSCIMNNSFIFITNSDVICEECKNDMIDHLKLHH